MPALDQGPRISWSASLLSFVVVYAASNISELCSDKDLSSVRCFAPFNDMRVHDCADCSQ